MVVGRNDLEIGVSRAILIKYSTKKLDSTQQVQFHYKLKGRGSKKGLLDKTHSYLVAKSVILAPKDTSSEVIRFLRENNCPFKIKKLIINPSSLKSLSKLASDFKKKHKEIVDIKLFQNQIYLISHQGSKSFAQEFATLSGIKTIHVQASQLLAPENELLANIRAGTSLLKEIPALPTTKKLFLYSTKHLRGSEKVKFHYALKGRGDKEGIITSTRSEFFAKSVIFTPESKAEVVRRLLARYSCEFVELEVAEISHGY